MIKAAYRQRARIYHPDRGNEAGPAKWNELQDAWRQACDAVEGLS